MKESFTLFSMFIFSISAMCFYSLFSLYPSQNFILNCSSSLTKLIIYIYKAFNSASNWFKIDISIFNNLENILNIIYYLPDLYQISRSNYYKYFKAYIKHKLNLSVEDIVNKVYLTISIKISWLV